jgi:hypothetical protein
MPELCSNSLKWNYIIMLRNLLASAIILAASTSAFAGELADNLNVEGASSSAIVTTALAACADADCKAAVLVEAIEAGVDAKSVMSIALAAGVSPKAASAAMRTANVSESDIVAAAVANNIDPTTITASTAGGTGTQDGGTNEGLKAAAEVPGISPGA